MKFSLAAAFCLAILISSYSFPQVDNIPSDNEVYKFLHRKFIEGLLTDYDDIILPLSRNQISKFLYQIRSQEEKLSPLDKELLHRFIVKLGDSDSLYALNFFDGFPNEFLENVASDKEKHLYKFKDQTVTFVIDPILNLNNLYSGSSKKGATLFNYGAKIRGSFDNWLGFSVQASNGVVFGDRVTALLDKRVEQSFTFNDTKINYFDETEGYVRLEKDFLDFQLGRERILWGRGQTNKLILSENPPQFDFIKFKLHYKILRYDFIHGWLVTKPEFVKIGDDISKEKRSKYIAISRLGINPSNNLSFGVSQMIIYSNRAFEAAYLNPFLFWESAQRSLNDLDNSFLVFDGRYKFIDGLLINGSAIFDDINFDRLFKGEWTGHNNGFAWQTGISLTNPILPENLILNLEYLQLRPYIFSHWGYKESLTYTNNGYLLGVDLQPNSTRFSVDLLYHLTSRITIGMKYFYSLHGNNEYDSLGNRTRNVGGNVFEYYTLQDSTFAYLLDGLRETEHKVRLSFNWEFLNNIYFNLEFENLSNSYFENRNYFSFFTSLKIKLD